MQRKKREFHSSELTKKLAEIYGFEQVLLSFKIKDFLQDYLDESLFNEFENIKLKNNILYLKIKSPLLRNDLQLRKSFYLKKISEATDITISDIKIIG